ncbi:MAG: aldo/keto reductase [Bauldia sp.]
MNSALDLDGTIRLHGDVEIPRLGLGVFRTGSGGAANAAMTGALERGYRLGLRALRTGSGGAANAALTRVLERGYRLGLRVVRAGASGATVDAVTWALERGYRLIDTAHIYRNEREVGEAVKNSPVPRQEIFLTTKLWNDDQGYDRTLRAFDESLRALQVDVIDLYLMHWPVVGKRLASWRAMERVFDEGRARAIGVSNFAVRHLEELFAEANIKPHINQIELHPFCQQPATVDWCREHGVVVEAYSPVTKGRRLGDATVQRIAGEVGKSPAQVLIRWGLQKGFVVIPKSANRQRIDENASVFGWSLSDAQMEALGALDADEHLAWNPSQVN